MHGDPWRWPNSRNGKGVHLCSGTLARLVSSRLVPRLPVCFDQRNNMWMFVVGLSMVRLLGGIFFFFFECCRSGRDMLILRAWLGLGYSWLDHLLGLVAGGGARRMFHGRPRLTGCGRGLGFRASSVG